MAVNAKGYFLGCKVAVTQMLKQVCGFEPIVLIIICCSYRANKQHSPTRQAYITQLLFNLLFRPGD